jgi:hypothetical protein
MKHDGKHWYLSTSQLCKELGFTVNSKKLREIGFPPTIETATGKYWKASEFPLICMALSSHINEIGINFVSDKKFKSEEAKHG